MPLDARTTFGLRIGDPLAAGRPESPSHPIGIAAAPGVTDVTLADPGGVRLDRDIVVRWHVARPAVEVTLDVTRPPAPAALAKAAYGLLTIVPPASFVRGQNVERDLAVLIDASGSMAGEPLEQAKRVTMALVDALGDKDQIELAAFSNASHRFHAEALPATAPNKRAATAWLSSLQAGGGTEMKDAILEALRPLREGTQRQVVVVTDGLIGFESDVLAAILMGLPETARLHTVGIGSSVNRSLTAPAARAGRGVEVIIGLGEDPERAAKRLVARTNAPLVVGLSITGSALLEHVPQRLPDLFAGAPALVGVRLRPEGGELRVSGAAPGGPWQSRLVVPPAPLGHGRPQIATLFGRELVLDLEMRILSIGDRAVLERNLERAGLDFQVTTRLTSWIAIREERSVATGAPMRRERIPQEVPHGTRVETMGLRPARSSHFDPAMRIDEKTRVTAVVARTSAPPLGGAPMRGGDCIIAIYSKEPTLLGKRFVLGISEDSMAKGPQPVRVGRGSENTIVLDSDAVSRRHMRIEARGERWWCVDENSTNGTFVNDLQIPREQMLQNGDRIKVGSTIFKYLSGQDVEAQYHEEIYRLTIIDGLTEAHVKRYLLESLDKELLRARRRQRNLSVLMFDIDHFKRINDVHGHLAGDHVLKELARLVKTSVRADDVFGRYGGEEFALVLPETKLTGARDLGEALRDKIARARFVFQREAIPVTISVGAATLDDEHKTALDLIKTADEKLYEAKRSGRNRVVI
jgi:diguanylate cyclase (GGDEF)-like protein